MYVFYYRIGTRKLCILPNEGTPEFLSSGQMCAKKENSLDEIGEPLMGKWENCRRENWNERKKGIRIGTEYVQQIQ